VFQRCYHSRRTGHVFYPFEVLGLQKQLARYVVKGPAEAEDYKLKVAIKMTGHGVLSLEYVERHDTVFVEEMVVDPPPANPAPADSAAPATDPAVAATVPEVPLSLTLPPKSLSRKRPIKPQLPSIASIVVSPRPQ